MMHPIDSFFSALGFVVSTLGFCTALFCSQEWVLWQISAGLALTALGMGLDKWREWKREQTKKVWR